MGQGLLMLVPTRSRVENALGFLETWYNTSSEDSSGLLFIVGTEDPALPAYKSRLPKEHLLIFPERGIVKATNYAVQNGYADSYEAVGFMGDDHRPRTFGWDKSYLDGLREMGAGFIYGNDLLMGERIPTQVSISLEIVETLGFFGPPGFTHLNVDVAWKDLGESIGRLRYLPDVVIEHMHPAAGKAKNDPGYAWANSKEMVARDGAEYERWKKCDLPHQAQALADKLGIVLP